MSKVVSWRVRIAGLVSIAAVASGVGAVAAPAAAAPACTNAMATEAAAAAIAARCKHDVVITATQTEYTQVVARPDGGRVFESAVVPQRAKRADGSWADIDLTLAADGKGVLRPRVSIADVTFSAGGSGPLVTMKRAGKTMTMSWSGRLPAPAVSGDTATYAGVFPDVDLVVRATRTGFTHVLVVKTPAAANSVRQVRFRMGGDARVSRAHDGTLLAAAGDVIVGRTKPAIMWDSAASGPASSARGASDLARVRAVTTEVTAGGELVLRPDATLLGAASAYPMFVDPDWEYGSGSGQKWAYATNNGENNTDYSVARVGKSPGSGAVYRSFFEFPTTGNTPTGSVSLKGKHIESAYVHMKLTHSSSCTAQYNYMYQTPVINATMKASWSSMTLSTFLASQSGHANEAGGCGVIQPDVDMNFISSTVTSQVQAAANNNANSFTVGFAARDTGGGGETTETRWMKYYPEQAVLKVDYDSKPTAPSSLQVSGVACPASGVLTVGTLTPNLSALHPDADSGDSLTGAYEWIEVPTGGMGTVTDTSPARKTAPPAIAGIPAGSRATTANLSGVAKGKTYAYRAKSTDKAPYSLVSPWSVWCQFKVDDTVPPVTVTIVTTPAGPGKPGTFTLSSTATDVTKFKWGWGAATTEVTATGTGPKTATITATVPKYGQNILFVSAVDTTLNEGFGSKEFTVGRPSAAVARWGLETYPGATQTAALADQQPTLAGNTPLTATNVTWLNDARLMGGQTAHFSGNASYMATSGPVLDTTKNYSVAAWARTTDLTNYQTIVTQLGASHARFTMFYSAAVQQWGFYVYDADSTSTAGNAVYGGTPVAGQWTHLAGVYNATHRTISLYVNGVRIGTTNLTGPVWNATGPVNVGRKMYNGASSQSFRGDIADVQLFDRVLVDHDFTGMLASDPDSGGFNEPGILATIKVGGWDFEAAVPCYVADVKDTCETPDMTGFNRWLAFSRGSAVGSGRSTNDRGLWLDGSYFPDEGNTETGTLEYARTAVKTGVTPPDGDGLEYTIWQNKSVLRTDQSFTVSAWAKVDRLDQYQTIISQDSSVNSGFALYFAPENGGRWKFKMRSSATAPDDTGTSYALTPALNADAAWQHVVVAVDVPARKMSMYVNGVRQYSSLMDAAWQPWQADGPLAVGRMIQSGATGSWFNGSIDDLMVYQGAMTDAAVADLHDAQA